MAMVMDIIVILTATVTMVTGIEVTTVQGMAPVIGDEIKEQGESF